MFSKQLNGRCQVKGYAQKEVPAPFIFSERIEYEYEINTS